MLQIQIPLQGITGSLTIVEQETGEVVLQFAHDDWVRHAQGEELSSKLIEIGTEYNLVARYCHGNLVRCTLTATYLSTPPSHAYHFFGVSIPSGIPGVLAFDFVYRDQLYLQQITVLNTDTYVREEARSFLAQYHETLFLPYVIEPEQNSVPIRCSLQQPNERAKEIFHIPLHIS